MADITADILSPNGSGPALSATSDMPVVEEAVAPPPAPAPTPDPEPVDDAEPSADPASEPTADPGPEPEEPKPEDNIARSLRSVSRERKEAVAERNEARAERDKLAQTAAELAELNRKLMERLDQQQAKPEPTAPPPPPEPRPRRQDFVDPDEYDTAVDAWNAANTRREIETTLAQREAAAKAAREQSEQETQQRQHEERVRTVVDTWNQRRTAFMEEHPDFAEVAEADGVTITLPMRDALLLDENGPAAAYYLGQHPDEATRIATLEPPRQVIEMGKLMATLAQPEAPKPRPPSAPAPVAPLRRSNQAAVNRSLQEIGDDPDGMAEYAASRMPTLQAERRPGGVFGRTN